MIADKGFAGAEFEQLVTALGAGYSAPTAKTNNPASARSAASGNGSNRLFDTLKDQLSLERHGGRTLRGLVSRIARRLLALTAAILHNWQLGNPGRRLTAYDH